LIGKRGEMEKEKRMPVIELNNITRVLADGAAATLECPYLEFTIKSEKLLCC